MTDEPKRCGGCRWWKHSKGDDGDCRRFPPAVFPRTDKRGKPVDCFTSWPPTDRTDWCGEWEQPK